MYDLYTMERINAEAAEKQNAAKLREYLSEALLIAGELATCEPGVERYWTERLAGLRAKVNGKEGR